MAAGTRRLVNSVSWQHLLLGGTPGAWAMGANLEEVKTQHTLTGILCNMVVMGEGHRSRVTDARSRQTRDTSATAKVPASK